MSAPPAQPSKPSEPSSPLQHVLPRPWLLADIGGTNARFGWLAAGSDDIAHVMSLRGTDHASVGPAARAYLHTLQQLLGDAYAPPGAAAFAVATPVTGDAITFTNSGWAFSRQALRDELGLQVLLVLNDFEALALSLPGLRPTQVQAIVAPHTTLAGPAAAPAQQATLAVIGPGTGLGVAGLVPTRHGWVAVPGEGGHPACRRPMTLRPRCCKPCAACTRMCRQSVCCRALACPCCTRQWPRCWAAQRRRARRRQAH
jgi:glucokinase